MHGEHRIGGDLSVRVAMFTAREVQMPAERWKQRIGEARLVTRWKSVMVFAKKEHSIVGIDM